MEDYNFFIFLFLGVMTLKNHYNVTVMVSFFTNSSYEYHHLNLNLNESFYNLCLSALVNYSL